MLVQKIGANGVVFEDVNPIPDLDLDVAAETSHMVRIVVGGVCAPDGSPVNLDQVVRITNGGASKRVLGFFVYEYLEP